MPQDRSKLFDGDITLVYCIQESLQQPFLSPDRRVAKIGIASKSIKTNFFSERLRALHQGNARILEVTNWRELPTREDAKAFEVALHEYVKNAGAKSMHDLTNATGHGEWFVLVGIENPDQVIENGFQYLQNQFNIGNLHTRLTRPIEYEIFTDLFEIEQC